MTDFSIPLHDKIKDVKYKYEGYDNLLTNISASSTQGLTTKHLAELKKSSRATF